MSYKNEMNHFNYAVAENERSSSYAPFTFMHILQGIGLFTLLLSAGMGGFYAVEWFLFTQ